MTVLLLSHSTSIRSPLASALALSDSTTSETICTGEHGSLSTRSSPRLDPGDIQKIVDQRQQKLTILADDREMVFDLAGAVA